MYEAIVGPLFSAVLNEAVKIPAIDRMVNQTEAVRVTIMSSHFSPVESSLHIMHVFLPVPFQLLHFLGQGNLALHHGIDSAL